MLAMDRHDTIPETMRAVVVEKFGEPYTINTIKVPKPAPHQVLIKIKAGGFCHTDCMALDGAFESPLPLVPSHEPAGIVVQVGSAVTSFQKGDRIGCINFETCCGTCPDCQAGTPIYCDNPRMKGLTTNGAWAEYMVADSRFTVKLPDAIDFPIAACLMCAGISIFGAIKRAQVPRGGSVAIVGIGGLGHIGTQLGKAMGYGVVAVDIRQSALDLVASYPLSADVGVLATTPPSDAVRQISNKLKQAPFGVDAAILATDSPAAFEFAAEITRKHGTLVLLGQPENGITMSYRHIIYRDLKLIGSLVADKDETEELLDLVVKHKIHLKVKEWSLDQVEAMRQEYLAGKTEGKNVVVI